VLLSWGDLRRAAGDSSRVSALSGCERSSLGERYEDAIDSQQREEASEGTPRIWGDFLDFFGEPKALVAAGWVSMRLRVLFS